MHMVRVYRLGLPQESREAFTLLEQAHLLTPEKADRMRAMVGFRNVAVHQYQQLSLPILRAILEKRLSDFDEFTKTLLTLKK